VLAAEVSIFTRLIACAVATLVGILLIIAGRQNILSESAEDTGRRRLLMKAMGKSTEHTGKSAVTIGKARIIMGILAIIFGILFLIFGPVLAD
jgi:uncharacterized membrane protein HdeD (DUF308 family)